MLNTLLTNKIALLAALILTPIKPQDTGKLFLFNFIVIFNTLDTITYRDVDADSLGLLSMAGGAPIMISGTMMAMSPNLNSVIFDPNWLSGVEIFGHDLTQSDEFSSNGMAGKIAYVTPSVMELFNAPYSAFNGDALPNGISGPLDFVAKIKNNDDNWFVTCTVPSSCYFKYRRDATPQLQAVTPNNVYKDQEMQFHLNIKNVHQSSITPDDEWPFREMRLGNTLLDWENTVEQTDRLPQWAHGTIQAVVTDQPPANNTEPLIQFFNGYAQNMPSLQACNYAGDDCWSVRSHPKIESISANTGFTTGGQTLLISGYGLNGTNVSVTVDGVACSVTQASSDSITCVTGQNSESVLGFQPGQPGLKSIKIDASTGLSFTKLDDPVTYPITETTLMTNFELLNMDSDDYYMKALSGWFRAPADGQYRFFMACDDWCQLSIDSTNSFVQGQTQTPSLTVIAQRKGATSWRNYFQDNTATEQHISDWITLQGGKSYYIVGKYGEWTGSEHFTVSVEIKPTAAIGKSHPQATTTMQQIAMDQVNTNEQWTLTISAPDSGKYNLKLQIPGTTPASYWTSADFAANSNAAGFKQALSGFFSKYWSSDIDVSLSMFDATSTLTTDATLATTYTYTITLKKMIQGFSFNAAAIIKVDTKSTFTIVPPSKGVQSSPPVNGTYAITCTDSQGNSFTSSDIGYNYGPVWIEYAITNSIPFLADKVKVYADYRYQYPENGLSFKLDFVGLDYEVPLCSVAAGSGLYPITGNNLVSNVTLLRSYGQSLLFEPVPLEFLTSDSKAPQVLVTVNGLQALCANLNCDYVYTVSEEIVTAQSLSSSGLLTITGTSLPTTSDVRIVFGPSECIVVTATASQITCQLNGAPVSGDWIVQVFTANGLTGNEITVPISIPVNAASITPNTDINFLGGDILTIAGDNFGNDASVIQVVFQDKTVCDIITVAMTAIKCKPRRFKSVVTTSIAVTVSINNETDSSLSIVQISTVQQSLTLVPSSASPVLKTELTIYLDSTYDTTLNASDFTAILINVNDLTQQKYLYIMSVNDADKTIKVKFPGAVSGQYLIQLSSVQHGNIQSDLLALSVHGTVTNVSPQTGSIYGGALVTITGENFSNNPLDNPVKIGDDYCFVITSTPTQITCRTDLLVGKQEGQETFLVFLKTSEEAQLADESFGFFTYVTPTATITDIVASFNTETLTHQVTVSGTGFDQSIELYLDGYQQQLSTYTATTAVFDVVNVNDIVTSDIKVYTSQGFPAGSDIQHTLEFTPSLLSIAPLTGSSGGSLVTVTGTGFGPQTVGLNIKAGTKTLCQQVTIIQYGQFTCLTNTGDIAPDTVLNLKINTTTQAGFVQASYSQSAIINVSAATITDNSIAFVGTGFPTDGAIGYASFGNIPAQSVVITDSQNCVAYWDQTGLASVTAIPKLYFANDVFTDYALIATGISLTKTLVVTSTTSDLVCSFNGGCTYSIESSGLTATLMNPTNSIQLCGSQCKLRTDLSDSNYAVCEVPPLATTYSVNNYQISTSGVLNETVFPAGSNLYDSDLMMDYVDTKTTGCQFGMTFKPNHVGILDEANIFINFLTSKTPYVGNLQLQGSNDNWSTFTVLNTYGQEIHEGWNYLNYRENATKPAYNSYRFYGTAKGACRVTEFRLLGVQAIADNNPTYQCTPVLNITGQVVTTNAAAITYSSVSTPQLISISPRFGSVLGGTTVTLKGNNLLGSGSSTVLFDDRECTVTSQTETQIVCITANKPWKPDTPRVNINIDGLGSVATQGLLFRYVSLWSSTTTWGGDIPPLEGESVSIPQGQHLLFDIDSSPKLNAIIVEGSLIFAPHPTNSSHLRTFDARYIMVEGGYLEVGTEDFPYTSKMQITMYGNKYDPYLPIYGNKVIGVRFGTIDMHGIQRVTTWTRLQQTAEAGDTSITVLESTDWAVGEEIVIATTSFDNNQSETRIITGVSGKTYSFAEPLVYQHLSVVPVYDGVSIPMQAEVGLLTRNVVYRGDPETSSTNLYGAHIMIHSPGDESSIGRIEYCELKDVGQAFKLGRYPLHYHMIGTVHKSYVRGNAIHQTYNRAVTTHGVHYFRVLNNVAFDTMGHTYFIEDAAETKNVYDHNLAIQVKMSNSLLNTDQSPGGFWITHPDNIVRNNAIAGTDAYGYWFDMKPHSTGPSFDINVCPVYTKLGEFHNNTAHSVHKYGLRIFHALIPRTHPCLDSPYDPDYLANGYTDPYWANPKVPAIFEDLIAWKCGRNGAITERTGAVVFKNFRIADSAIAGIEFSMIEDVVNGYAMVQGGTVVGNTQLNDVDQTIANSTVWGFIGPRTENMQVHNLKFFNFDFQESAALGTCSHCFHPASTDSGGRTFQVSGLYFDDATVPRRIKYQVPYREIIHDLDGSLTGLGPNTFATFAYPHTDQPECQTSIKHNGTICDSTVQIRRIVFHHSVPSSFGMQKLKIAKWDDSIRDTITADNQTLWDFGLDVDWKYFSRVDYRPKLNPNSAWPACYVTGHKYRVHFGDYNMDFTQMQLQTSERWEETDLNVHFMMNFTDVRAAINITDSAKYLIPNETYSTKSEQDLESGDNVLFNQTEVREFHFVINGKNLTNRQNMVINGYRCVVNCLSAPVANVTLNSTLTYWSQNSSWVSGKVPVEGDEVEILPGVNMILDVSTPILKKLTINGRLTFLNNLTNPLDLQLNAKIIFVRAGELFIGNATNPFEGNATIRLFGNSSDESLAYSATIEGGNKILAVLGTASLYGKSRDMISRLKATVYKGDLSATVSSGLDWVKGDQLAIMPTTTSPLNVDYVTIDTYDATKGIVTFTEKLKFYHWGAPTSTAAKYNGIDMRGEVIMLSRNVKIVGNDTGEWGGQVVVSDTLEEDLTERTGQITFDNVEIYNCSQINTYKSAIRFEGAVTKAQSVTNSAIHGSRAWSFSAQFSSNIFVQNTHMIGSRAIGLGVITSQDIELDNLIVGGIERRAELSAQNVVDKEACYSICAYESNHDKCSNISLTNSIASGCYYAGFVAPGHDCGDAETQTNFRGNLAHSVLGCGAHIYPDPNKSSHLTCYSGSYFSAYKNSQTGVGTQFVTQEIQMSQMTLIDNTLGVNIQASGESDKSLTTLSNTIIYGETPAEDCPKNQPNCWCNFKMGFMLFGSNMKGKDFHINSPSPLPMHKIKSYGTWMAATEINNVTFSDFPSNKTACGHQQMIFGVNEHASDYIPLHKFTNTKFNNVHDDAMAYIYDPPEEWNNPTDCIAFPCTAPSNIVISFEGTSFSGATRPSMSESKFQIISDTPGASDTIQNCEFKELWNAWQCTNKNIGVLVFIGDDSDWEDRMVSPVYVTNPATNFTNKLNNMMDHMWDGFYTGQKHKSQFPSMLEATGNITVEYTGTPFKNMRYKLIGSESQIKVKVPYWNAGVYSVYVNDKLVNPTAWDKTLGSQAELTGYKGCGENRFVGVKNYLEFILTPGCQVTVKPTDAILSDVRMQWTLAEFYAQGGTTSFADRVAGALGIHASQIKVVAVYQGSVVVSFAVAVDETSSTSSSTQQTKLTSKLNSLITSNSTAFGAPILSASTGGTSIVTDPNYNPNANVNTGNQNQVTVTGVVKPKPVVQQQVTIATTQEEESVSIFVKNTNLIWILAVLVSVFVCCFGASAILICIIKLKKKPQVQTLTKDQPGNLASEVELNPQFHPNQEIEIDIFTNKKRGGNKVDQDFVYEANSTSVIDHSAHKLVNQSNQFENNIQNQVQNLQDK